MSNASRPIDDDPSGHSFAAVARQLERYWRELRGARAVPARADVVGNNIDAALPHAFILDRVARGVGRIRVGGQRLQDCLGMDARGMPLTAFFIPAVRDRVAGMMDAVFDGPAIVEMPLTARVGLLGGQVRGRLLLLPLAGPDGSISRALGALVTDRAVSAPLRFGLDGEFAVRTEILPANGTAFSVIEGGGGTEKGPERRRPALRLVVSDA